MNKAIAHILMSTLLDLPFIEKFGGLVSVQEEPCQLYDEEAQIDKRILKRYPVTNDYHIPGSTDPVTLKDFVPDQSFTGMLYFEDKGCDPAGREGKAFKYISRLRLIVWLNTDNLVNDATYQSMPAYAVPGALMTSIQASISVLENTSVSGYMRLRPRATTITQQDKSIFSPYTHDLYATQFIMLPFEYFAIDYSIEFRVNPNCLPKLAIADVDLTGMIYDKNNPSSFVTVGDKTYAGYKDTNS